MKKPATWGGAFWSTAVSPRAMPDGGDLGNDGGLRRTSAGSPSSA